MQNIDKSLSWGLIVVCFIVFWPVGLFLLFRKLSLDKSATFKNSKTVEMVSYALMGFGVIYLLMAISGRSTMLMAVALGGGGIWVNQIARRMKSDGEKYKKYISAVVNQSQTSIDNISSMVGVSYETAVTDLTKMIDSGYFVGAYINENTREIVMSAVAQQPAMSAQSSTQTQYKVATCQSCGANNSVVVGRVTECEYCGSPVQ